VPAIERVLGRVRKPGRYAGGELNSVQKDWSATALKWCLAYPDLYEIGMSNLGLRILYEVLNDRATCWPNAASRLTSTSKPSSGRPASRSGALRTRRPLCDFDVVG